jgi:hypothetical protein
VSNADPEGVGHWSSETQHIGRCRQCSKSKKRSEVKWQCSSCKIHLCVKCFEVYHKELQQ